MEPTVWLSTATDAWETRCIRARKGYSGVSEELVESDESDEESSEELLEDLLEEVLAGEPRRA